MGLGSTVRKILIADASVAALVGTRIFPKALPQNPPLPAITYQRISRTALADTLEGPGTLVRPRVQIDTWAKTDAEAITVGAAVRRALNGFRGPVAGEPDVQRIALDNVEDSIDAELLLHRQRADFFVFHEED